MNAFLETGSGVVLQVGILFVLIFAGGVATKCKWIDRHGVDVMINILLYLVTPCLIIDSFLKVEFSFKTAMQLGIAGGCAVLTHLVGIAFSYLFWNEKDKRKKSVYRFGVIFSNGGFMAMPMAQALFGEQGVFYGSAYVIVFNILQWTYGISLMDLQQGKASLKKVLVNPGTIGVLIGIPLFFFRLPVPQILSEPIGYLATLNTPLAMLITGFFLVTADFKSGLFDRKMWVSFLLRLLVIPGAMLLLFRFGFGLGGVLLSCCVLPACAPCAVNTMILSAKFGGDTALASRMIALSTLLSVLTMPVLLALSQI